MCITITQIILLTRKVYISAHPETHVTRSQLIENVCSLTRSGGITLKGALMRQCRASDLVSIFNSNLCHSKERKALCPY